MRRSVAVAGLAALVVVAFGWGVVRFVGRGAASSSDTANPEARRLVALAWSTVHSAPEPSRPEID
ncbi:MAG TPA: hypothetical protein VM029_12480, partial [Opitutaceae bacterium]|nr:hypothetical protein [Opitutaceae bacterium]